MTNSNLFYPFQVQMQQWTVNLKRPAAGLLVGGLWGLLILGVGSRVAMRLVALIMGIPPSATATGTLGLLLMGGFAGGVIGALYALITRWLLWQWRTNAALFSILLAAVALQPFLGERTGEAALAPPWIGAPLFVVLPLLFTPLLAYTIHRLEPQINAAPRPVGLGWFLAFLVPLGLAFINLIALGENVRIPQLVSTMMAGARVPFQEMQTLLGLWGALVGLCFALLHLLVFWLGAHQPLVKLMSIGQLLLAGVLIRAEPLFPFLTGSSAGSMGELIAWCGLTIGAIGALLWAWRQPARLAIRVTLVSFGLPFLLLWLAILLMPAMQLRGWIGVQSAVAVAPYLTLWLLMPAGLSWVARRQA